MGFKNNKKLLLGYKIRASSHVLMEKRILLFCIFFILSLIFLFLDIGSHVFSIAPPQQALLNEIQFKVYALKKMTQNHFIHTLFNKYIEINLFLTMFFSSFSFIPVIKFVYNYWDFVSEALYWTGYWGGYFGAGVMVQIYMYMELWWRGGGGRFL